MPKAKMTFDSPFALKKIDEIINVLSKEQMTLFQLEKTMLCGKNSLYPYLVHLRKQKRIFVSDYVVKIAILKSGKEHKSKTAMFKAGIGVDLKRSAKPYKQREKIDVEISDMKVKIVKATDVPFFKNTDPLMQALYGMI